MLQPSDQAMDTHAWVRHPFSFDSAPDSKRTRSL